MPVTSIRFYTSPVRRQPKTGDRRTTKAHGEQVRVPTLAKDTRGRVIGYLCNGGRQNYSWVSPEEAYQRYPYLRPTTA